MEVMRGSTNSGAMMARRTLRGSEAARVSRIKRRKGRQETRGEHERSRQAVAWSTTAGGGLTEHV
jgi:hypothetical protein